VTFLDSCQKHITNSWIVFGVLDGTSVLEAADQEIIPLALALGEPM
jgi:hypothetical protein